MCFGSPFLSYYFLSQFYHHWSDLKSNILRLAFRVHLCTERIPCPWRLGGASVHQEDSGSREGGRDIKSSLLREINSYIFFSIPWGKHVLTGSIFCILTYLISCRDLVNEGLFDIITDALQSPDKRLVLTG